MRHRRREVAYQVHQSLISELTETGDLDLVNQRYLRDWVLSLRPFCSDEKGLDLTIEGEMHQLIVIGRTELQLQWLH